MMKCLYIDYFGVGRSSGKFSDGSVGRWAQDTITLIENTVGKHYGKVVLVGHGVGKSCLANQMCRHQT